MSLTATGLDRMLLAQLGDAADIFTDWSNIGRIVGIDRQFSQAAPSLGLPQRMEYQDSGCSWLKAVAEGLSVAKHLPCALQNVYRATLSCGPLTGGDNDERELAGSEFDGATE